MCPPPVASFHSPLFTVLAPPCHPRSGRCRWTGHAAVASSAGIRGCSAARGAPLPELAGALHRSPRGRSSAVGAAPPPAVEDPRSLALAGPLLRGRRGYSAAHGALLPELAGALHRSPRGRSSTQSTGIKSRYASPALVASAPALLARFPGHHLPTRRYPLERDAVVPAPSYAFTNRWNSIPEAND
ncbi:hypothetical protein SEVIR_7G136301v4 [Setaria viridis]